MDFSGILLGILYQQCERNTVLFVLNDIVKLDLFMKGECELSEQSESRLVKWLGALGVDSFEKYVCDREFHGNVAEAPRRLRLFVEHKIPTIAVSEASVERCFSMHKQIHTPLRSSLSDDLVQDILYIRYNHTHLFPNVFTIRKTECDDEDDMEPFEQD
jgi:hypothetical protein